MPTVCCSGCGKDVVVTEVSEKLVYCTKCVGRGSQFNDEKGRSGLPPEALMHQVHEDDYGEESDPNKIDERGTTFSQNELPPGFHVARKIDF
jgi:hypothetical protein